MLKNIIGIIGTGVVALIITGIARAFRQRGSFNEWWNAEGIVVFIISAAIVGLGWFF